MVYVDIPHHVQHAPTSARVVGTTWNSARDTTLLQLDLDTGYAPARLSFRGAEVAASRQPIPVRVRGYPSGTPEGLSVAASVIGPGGHLPQRTQVDIDPRQPVRFEPGFSGCGVVDPRDGSVIGILTSALEDAPDVGGRLSDRHGRVGLMEPVEMVESLREHSVDTMLERVHRVLGDLRFDAVLGAYGAATQHRATERVQFSSAWEAFVYLRDLTPRPDGLPCEVVFVEEIARRGVVVPESLWAYTNSGHLSEVPPDALARLREPDAAPAGQVAVAKQHAEPALIVAAEPVPNDPDTTPCYLVSHWLHNGHAADRGTSFPTTADGLRDAVLGLIEHAEAQLLARDSAAELLLEFVLPFPLLTQPIAQWRLSDPWAGQGAGERVGAAYEIILHAHERLNDVGWERARRNIQHRWHVLTDNGKGRMYLVPPEPATDVGSELRDHLAARGLVFCVLGTAAELAGGTAQLSIALQAGLPCIAWLHGADEDQTRRFHRRISMISHTDEAATICAEDLASLPRRLREWRTQNEHASDDGYDPYDVTVILDDMDKIRDLEQAGILMSPSKRNPYD